MNKQDLLNEVLQKVDSNNLLEHVTFLSGFERESGSPGEWKAADYFAQHMTSLGLKTEVRRIRNLISQPVSAELQCQGEIIPCITHSYAANSPAEGLEIEAVFREKHQQQDVSFDGKAVISYGLASPLASYTLERKGAAALIFINGGEYEHNMSISPVWGMPLPEDLEDLCRIPVISLSRKNGEKLLERVRENPKVWLKTKVETSFREVPLCIADLTADKKSDRYILFNGHSDSWHKGATDNGAANAAILEIARILTEYRHVLQLNIRFVWWSGHSNGRYSGSNWYADYEWEDIHQNAVVNINIDAIGSVGSTIYPTVIASSQCFTVGYKAIHDLTGQEPAYSRIQRNGDQSFWGHGVPSLYQVLSLQPEDNQQGDTFVSGLPWFWHTTEDKIEYVDEKVLHLDTQIYLQAIWHMATAATVPFSFALLADEMERDLISYQDMTDRVDLSFVLQQAKSLKEHFKRHDQMILAVNESNHSPETPDFLTERSMDINRLIMPVYYCASSPFEVDDALPSCPFPGLKAMSLIRGCENELLQEAYIRKCQRALNRISHMFTECISLFSN